MLLQMQMQMQIDLFIILEQKFREIAQLEQYHLIWYFIKIS